MKLRTLTTAIVFAVTGHAHAATVDVALSDESARFALSSFVGGFSEGRTIMSSSLFYNTENDGVVSAGLHMIDVVGSKTPGLQVGVGFQAYYSHLTDHDGIALALGGVISYRAPQLQRVNFVIHGHHAPSITSYMDSERLSEYGVSIEYSLLPQADIYIGYRKIEVDDQGLTLEMDDSGHIGLRITF